jgi:peroxiredoxin
MRAALALISLVFLLFSACGQDATMPVPEPEPEPVESILQEQLDIADCDRNTTEKTKVQDLMGEKATLISMHTGWCSACKNQVATMEAQYQQYKDRGFEAVLVLLQDNRRNSDYDSLLKCACEKTNDYKLTFPVAIDPGAIFYGKYRTVDAVPFNMILDKDGNIVLKMPGYGKDRIEDLIENLLEETY